MSCYIVLDYGWVVSDIVFTFDIKQCLLGCDC